MFHIQRRDKNQDTKRCNSRITGRYRQLYMFLFSHILQGLFRIFNFCRYVQPQGLNFTCNINKKKKKKRMQNIIMQGVQSSVASTVADPSPGRDLISQSQQPAKRHRSNESETFFNTKGKKTLGITRAAGKRKKRHIKNNQPYSHTEGNDDVCSRGNPLKGRENRIQA